MNKQTATYWDGIDYGIRILDIEHGIDDYGILTFIMNRKESDPFRVKIEYDEDGNAGFWINGGFYPISDFIKDGYPNI